MIVDHLFPYWMPASNVQVLEFLSQRGCVDVSRESFAACLLHVGRQEDQELHQEFILAAKGQSNKGHDDLHNSERVRSLKLRKS